MLTKTRLKIGLLAVGVAAAIAIPVANAQSDDDPDAAASAEVCDWAPTADEAAEIQAETDELAAHLDELGIAHEIVTDECGVSWVEWDWDDPEAAAAVDEFFGPFVDDWGIGLLEELDPDQALADIANLLDGLAAHLDAAGIEHEIHNLPVVTWDMSDEAANDAVADFMETAELPFLDELTGLFDLGLGDFAFDGEWFEFDGGVPFEFEFDGDFPFGGEFGFELPPELLEELNAAADDLAAFLDERGIPYESSEGPDGARMVIPDLTDPAAREALEEYLEENGHAIFGGLFPGGEFPFGEGFDFGQLLPGDGFPFGDGFEFGEVFPHFGDGDRPLFDGLPEELVAELNASADELAAFLDERGIPYEVEEGPMGIRMVIPDLSAPGAEEALDEYVKEHGLPFFDFEFHGPGGHFGFDGSGPFGGFFEFFEFAEPEGSRA